MPVLSEIGQARFVFREMTPEEKERNGKMVTLDFILDYFFSRSVPRTKYSGIIDKPKSLNDHVKILSSATGSGKGSIGFELYLRYWPATHKNIAVLQPTITTAIGVPMEIVSNVPKIRAEFRLGKNFGFQTGYFVRKPVSGVIFMTTGVLNQMLRVMTDEQFIQKFGFILIDEAHMRRIDTDIIMFQLKQLLLRNVTNPECPKVIPMSGTMPIRKYSQYLQVNENDIIDVRAQLYPKEEHYAEHDVEDYVEEVVRIVMMIHTTLGKNDAPERGDIVVFIKSAEPGKKITKRIMEENEKMDQKIIVTNVNSEAFNLGTNEYFDTIRPLKDSRVTTADGKQHIATRRLVLGTPAMEAGLTLGTLKYCIETGYEHAVQYNPIYNCTVEGAKPISKASMRQRIGRVGRKFPGVFYTMYSKKTFELMEEQPDPDIWIRDITSLILNIMISECMPPIWSKLPSDFHLVENDIKSFDPSELDLLDAPSADSLSSSLEKLFILGFINSSAKPTLMGCMAIRFPRSPIENLRMIFEGYLRGANVEDLITMAAILEASPSMLINTSPLKGGRFSPINIFGINGVQAKDDQSPSRTFTGSDWREKQKYVGCDLIELLFVFYEIRAKIKNLTNIESKLDAPSISSTRELRDWMSASGLIYDQWMRVFSLRDDILMMCIASGLDPYINGLGIAQHEYNLVKILKESRNLGTSEIRKLKACIFEGYRLNTATWSTFRGHYISDLSGVPLVVKPLAQSNVSGKDITAQRPRKIIIFNNSLHLPQKSTDGKYAFESSLVSVIDGFIDIDETFNIS